MRIGSSEDVEWVRLWNINRKGQKPSQVVRDSVKVYL